MRLLLALAATLVLAVPASASAAATRACGPLDVYDQALTLTARGVSCAKARTIATRCKDVEGDAGWSCVGTEPLESRDVMVWFRSSQRFAKTWEQRVAVRRHPCSASRFSASEWRVNAGNGFEPGLSRRQLIADDLVRCKRLLGRTKAQVAKLLGRATETSARESSWQIGQERGTLFPIDGEFLNVAYTASARVKAAGIAAG